ncbi:MAG: hypothetical protein IT323_09410, partial [Anaerolineae bacterium]|nr:hypothetical protein [Anaerolineae bacterium]
VGVSVQSGSRTDGMLKYARGLCRRSFPRAQPLVNFQNGTLDLATMRLRVHQRDNHLTRCLPYDFEIDAAFPLIRAPRRLPRLV